MKFKETQQLTNRSCEMGLLELLISFKKDETKLQLHIVI